MEDYGDLQIMLEELAEWFDKYGQKHNDLKLIMRHTRDNIVHCSLFAEDLNAFGDIFLQKDKVVSEFVWDEMGYR